MAVCFLSGTHLTAEGVINYAQGKTYVPGLSVAGTFGKVYSYDQGKRSKKDIGLRDKLVGLLSYMANHGDSGQKILLGDVGHFHANMNTIYVVGSKSSILRMFEEADSTPEIVISPTLYVGLCKWSNVVSANKYGVRIKAGKYAKADPRQNSSKPHFWDTDVTEDLHCIVKPTSVHPRAFVQTLKNVFDRNKMS